MMLLGYARVSTNEQDTAAQVSALKSAGCEKDFPGEGVGRSMGQTRVTSPAGPTEEGRCSGRLAS